MLSILINKLPLSESSGPNLHENTNSGLNVPISMSDAILKVQLKSVNQDDIQPRKIGMIKKTLLNQGNWNFVSKIVLTFCENNLFE